jgi:hypothetical protein
MAFMDLFSALVDLFRPKWKNSQDSVRYRAVDNLDNETTLIKVVKTDKASHIRERAVMNERLTDQAVLSEVVATDKDSMVRVMAADKLQDRALAQVVYREVARNPRYNYLSRMCAIRNLTDQAILAEVAEDDYDPKLRRDPKLRVMAADKLQDKALAQAAYRKIATDLEHSDRQTRDLAISKLSNTELRNQLTIDRRFEDLEHSTITEENVNWLKQLGMNSSPNSRNYKRVIKRLRKWSDGQWSLAETEDYSVVAGQTAQWIDRIIADLEKRKE